MQLRPEDRLQVHCARYLRDALPEPAWFSGIEHAGKKSLMAGNIQKSKGIRRGLPDLNIWYLGQYIGIELKVKSPVSEPQYAFGHAMQANGFRWVVVRSVEQLHDALLREGVPVRSSMRMAAMAHDAMLSVPPKAPKPRASRPAPNAKPSAARIKRITASVYGVKI